MRVAAYLRVSTSEQQSVASQRADIETYLKTRSTTLVRWFEDVGVSGGRLDRPGFGKLMAEVRKRRFDLLVAYRLDRVSRSLIGAVHVLDELRRADVRLVTLADGISFEGPYGSLLFASVAGLAELEREAIRERVRAGLRNARAKGVRLGRAPEVVEVEAVRGMRASGATMKGIAAEMGVSVRTLQRRLRGATVTPAGSGS